MLFKYIQYLISCVFVLIIHQSSYAQTAYGRWSFGSSGGFGLPIHSESFRDHYNADVSVGGELMFSFSSMTHLCLKYTYQPFKFNEDHVADRIGNALGEFGNVASIDGGSADFHLLSLDLLQYVIFNPRRFGFYVIAGGDYAIGQSSEMLIDGNILDYTFTETDTLGSQTGLGFHVGVGFSCVLSRRIGFFIHGCYHRITFESLRNYFPETFRIEAFEKQVSYFSIVVGMRYIFKF